MTKPTLDDFTSRVMRGCQLLKSNGLEDVAALLARNELHDRQARARTGKRKAYIGNKRTPANEFYIEGNAGLIDRDKIDTARALEEVIARDGNGEI